MNHLPSFLAHSTANEAWLYRNLPKFTTELVLVTLAIIGAFLWWFLKKR